MRPSQSDQQTGPNGLLRGVVAVIRERSRFLVIKRSQYVVAPGAYCFPGGAIEEGELEPDALQRELMEELSVPARPLRRLWQSVTHRRVRLAWWLAERSTSMPLIPSQCEVESIHWMAIEEMLDLPDLLQSNRGFLKALADGEISL